jgi:predicted ester cyclase
MQSFQQIALASFKVIENGDDMLAAQIIHPDFRNVEADDDPEDVERQEKGVDGFIATSTWLRSSFSELRFDINETATENKVVFVACIMKGVHTGVFQGIAPTGKTISQKQVHIFTFANDKIIAHRAVRDDLHLLLSLGWKPSGARR